MIGDKLLHYELVEMLGEGGMGVVYKARDTHLDRFVAVKVLPPEKVADPTRKARFIQEAKAASALNHANIVHIYDIAAENGIDFIAMEYVAGKTLDQLIPRKGLRLGEALKIAIQIASALARAHAAGIVHRDLKPSNVMVDEHGGVKLLDFGLAKLVEQGTSDDAATATIGVKTEEGTVVGTAAYMSPEQAQGRVIDARSDIFTFGAVLYEMLAGHHAFQGTSKISVLSAVLHEEPAPLAADVPYELRRLVERCLRKDPERRLHGMDDVKLALEDLKQESDSGKLSGGGETVIAGRRKTTYVWAAAVAIGVVLLIAAGLWRFVPREHSHAAMRETPFVVELGSERFPVFSPDGETVAFMNHPESVLWYRNTPERSIRLKMLGTDTIQELKKNAWGAAWSPDGKRFAYYTGTSPTTICVIPRTGGAESKITEVRLQVHPDRTLAWTSDGKYLISQDKEGEKPFHLVLVSVEGGEKVPLTTPPDGIHGDSGPALSPDRRTLVFTRWIAWQRSTSDLYLLALNPTHRPFGEPRLLKTNMPAANCGVWTPDGKEIVFCSQIWNAATLWRIPSSGLGRATPLPFGGRGAYCPDIARAGNRLIYVKHIWDLNIWRVELDPSGVPTGPPKAFIASSLGDAHAAWSPDGKAIALLSDRGGTHEIWVCDASGKNERKLTSMDNPRMEPHWSPDSRSIAFVASEQGNVGVYVVSAAGGKVRRLTLAPNAGTPHWSADGQWLHFFSTEGGEPSVRKISLHGGEAVPAPDERPGHYAPGSADLFFPEGGTLWKKPASGGAAELVVSGMANSWYAVSSKGVYFTVARRESPQSPWAYEITFHDFETGRRTKIAGLHPGTGSGTGLSLSPDGSYLLYTQCDRETDDLMLVENFR